MNWASYFLGVLTVPAVSVAGFAVVWLVMKKWGRDESEPTSARFREAFIRESGRAPAGMDIVSWAHGFTRGWVSYEESEG